MTEPNKLPNYDKGLVKEILKLKDLPDPAFEYYKEFLFRCMCRVITDTQRDLTDHGKFINGMVWMEKVWQRAEAVGIEKGKQQAKRDIMRRLGIEYGRG